MEIYIPQGFVTLEIGRAQNLHACMHTFYAMYTCMIVYVYTCTCIVIIWPDQQEQFRWPGLQAVHTKPVITVTLSLVGSAVHACISVEDVNISIHLYNAHI